MAVDVDQRRIIVNKLPYFVNRWEHHVTSNSCQLSGLGTLVLSNFTSYKLRLSEKQTTAYFVNNRFHCYKKEKAFWGNNNILICL